MDLEESRKELERQFAENGEAIVDDKTLPAISDIVERAIERQKKKEEEAGDPPPLNEGIDLWQLGGNCPVQGEGTFDGVEFYFRARGCAWSIEVGEKPPTCPASETNWHYREAYGDGPYAAGWMVLRDAYDAINRSYRMWKQAKTETK